MGGDYGPSTSGTRINYFSASSLTTGDPNSYGGCNRAYHYKYVQKIQQEQTAAMTRGTKMLHEPIERYYQESVDALTPLVIPGKKYMYERGPRMLIEREIAIWPKDPRPTEGTLIDLTRAPLRAAGTPLVGKMDLLQWRGSFLDAEGVLQPEPHPDVTLEINDWKSTSKREYAKTAAELLRTIQMITYGKYGLIVAPRVEWVRLSHTYFLTQGRAQSWKETILASRYEIERRWEYVDGLARELQHVAAEPDVEKVTPNRKACNSYGKGCPFKGICSAGRFTSLSPFSGRAPNTNTEQHDPMSILKKVTGTVTPVNTPEHVGVNLTLGTAPAPGPLSMLDILEAEDAGTAAPAAPAISPELIAAFKVIDESGLGCPQLKGEAADARAEYTFATTGVRAAYTPGATLNGSGKLAGLAPVDNTAMILAIAEDIRKRAAKTAAAQTPAPVVNTPVPVAPGHQVMVVDLLAPEAPASKPELASKPVEGFSPQGTPPGVPVLPDVTTHTVDAQTTIVTPETTKAEAPPAEKPTKAKAERKTKHHATKPGEEPFELFIDCIPSKPFEMLDAQLNAWHAEMVAYFGLTEFPDMRCAPKSVPLLAYGAHEGTWQVFIAEKLAEGALARGTYVLLTNGDKIKQLAAEGMTRARHKSAEGVEQQGPAVLDGYTRGVR